MNKYTKDNVKYFLTTLQNNGYLLNYSIVNSDGRLGKLIALAIVTDNSIDTKTDYMSCYEMIQYLRGYSNAIDTLTK